MTYLLDIIASSFIAGFVILIIINLNIQISENSRKTFENTYLQSNTISTGEIIEYDFYKIGYHVNSDSAKILLAELTRLKFCSDLANVDKIDTLDYFVGDTADATFSGNPNDYPLYRQKNGEDTVRISNVNQFSLIYYDDTNSEILTDSLAISQIWRDQIRSIKVNFIIESYEPISYDSTYIQDSAKVLVYEGAEYQKIVKLKNIY